MSTESAQMTLDASITLMPTLITTLENTPTTTPAPTNTDLPQPSVTPTPAQTTNNGSNFLILMAAGIVAIIILGYFISKRMRGGAG
jgi:hypothetical protein